MTDEEFDRQTGRGPGSRPLAPDERRNVEVVLRSYAAFPHQWKADEQQPYYTPDFVDHSSIHGATFADMVAFVKGFRDAFPQGSIEIERILADGDFVIAKVKPRLSPDHPPEEAMEIYRFEAGRIAEHWDVIRSHTDAGAAHTSIKEPAA